MRDNLLKEESALSKLLGYFDNSEVSDPEIVSLFFTLLDEDEDICADQHLILKAVKGKRSNLEVIKVFFNNGDGYDLNAVDEFGRTPLFYANDVEIALFLLKKGAICDVKDRDNHTPISYLISQDMMEIVRGIIGHVQGCDKLGIRMNNALVSMQLKLDGINRENINSLVQDGLNTANWNRAHVILLCADHSASFTSGISLQHPPAEIPWSDLDKINEHVALYNKRVESLLVDVFEVFERPIVEGSGSAGVLSNEGNSATQNAHPKYLAIDDNLVFEAVKAQKDKSEVIGGRGSFGEQRDILGQVHPTPRMQADVDAKRQEFVRRIGSLAGLEASEPAGSDLNNMDGDLRRNAIIGSAAVLCLGFVAFKSWRKMIEPTEACSSFMQQENGSGFGGDLIAEAGITMLAIYSSYVILAKARDRAAKQEPEIEVMLDKNRIPEEFTEWAKSMREESEGLDNDDSLTR